MDVGRIVDGILGREGRGTPPYERPGDAGGRTSWGISERAHPAAWANGPPSRAAAREILIQVYIFPFTKLMAVGNDRLLEAIIDDAVLSGTVAATKRLQWVLGVELDGQIGPRTIEAMQMQAGNRLQQRYVVERVIRLTRLVERRPADLVNLTGWIGRALAFLPEPA